MPSVRANIRRYKQAFKPKRIAAALVSHAETRLKAADEAVGVIAKDAADFTRRGILSRRFDMDPLSPDYKAWKRAHGRDARTLVSTGEYARRITSWKVRPLLYAVGVEDGRHASGVKMSTLMRVLENGTDKVPARPHFRQSRLRAKNRLKKMLARMRLESRHESRRVRVAGVPR